MEKFNTIEFKNITPNVMSGTQSYLEVEIAIFKKVNEIVDYINALPKEGVKMFYDREFEILIQSIAAIQNIAPVSFADSITYYEQLNTLKDKINELVEVINKIEVKKI